MSDEYRVLQAEFAADFDDVVGIAGQRRILGLVVGLEIRPASADVIENDRHVVFFELRSHEPPHVLVAAEPVREDHGPVAAAPNMHVVSLENACHTAVSW
jgi:hypothetical protein